MIFVTIEFVLFFLTFLIAYSLFGQYKTFTYTHPPFASRLKLQISKQRVWLICTFNAVFYITTNAKMFAYLLALVGVTHLLAKISTSKLSSSFSSLSIVSLLALQIVFWKLVDTKYIDLFSSLVAPLGVSFFTFQAINYLLALRKTPSCLPHLHISQQWSFLKLFAFMGFFPTLLCGPILRASAWHQDLQREYVINKNDLHTALSYILIGCFYKLTLASYLNTTSTLAFSDPLNTSSAILWQGFYAYGFEIFHDFAGYSLMSIGVAKMFGFNIPMNFNAPYFSENLKIFWTRWHISLSSFFRDYVYIPLNGSRAGVAIQLRNVFIVMTLSGLWHGLSTNYLIWAGLHTIGICACVLWGLRKTSDETKKSKIKKFISIIINIHYVFFAWIFFASNDASSAFNYINQMMSIKLSDLKDFSLLFFAFIIFCIIVQYKESKIIKLVDNLKFSNNLFWILFWAIAFLLVIVISPSGTPAFIYSQY